jgi:hypothetical protein
MLDKEISNEVKKGEKIRRMRRKREKIFKEERK